MTAALFLAPAFFALATVAPGAEKFTFSRPLMGTGFSVVCYAEDRAKAEKAVEAAFVKANEVNTLASDYLPESELSLLSSKPIGVSIPLSPLLFDLLLHARRIAETTNGAFDPTLGSMTKLWRETRASGQLPNPEMLAGARTVSGWRHFTLDPKNRTITLLRENMAFDLGGVAKGYAADMILDSLAASGIRQVLVTAGGDIRIGDAPPGREGWNVALKTFDILKNEEILTLSNAAISTSGDLHQSVEIDGVSYSHILNPATGLGLTHRIAASVIADEAKFSDAFATAACVLGQEGSKAFQDYPGVREVRVHKPQETQPKDRKASP